MYAPLSARGNFPEMRRMRYMWLCCQLSCTNPAKQRVGWIGGRKTFKFPQDNADKSFPHFLRAAIPAANPKGRERWDSYRDADRGFRAPPLFPGNSWWNLGRVSEHSPSRRLRVDSPNSFKTFLINQHWFAFGVVSVGFVPVESFVECQRLKASWLGLWIWRLEK